MERKIISIALVTHILQYCIYYSIMNSVRYLPNSIKRELLNNHSNVLDVGYLYLWIFQTFLYCLTALLKTSLHLIRRPVQFDFSGSRFEYESATLSLTIFAFPPIFLSILRFPMEIKSDIVINLYWSAFFTIWVCVKNKAILVIWF